MRTFPHIFKPAKLIVITVLAIIIACIFSKFFQVAIVSGHSMEPTLKNRQVVLVSKTGGSYEREDIVTFQTDDYGVCVKRIGGAFGDKITLKQGKVYRNDIELPMYTCDADKDYEVILNQNQIFVMGDNSNESIDSRDYGPIDIHTVIGVVRHY